MKRLIYSAIFLVLSVAANAQEVCDTVIVVDGYRYEWQWPEGQGVLYNDFKGFYVGTFLNGLPDGYCVQFTPFEDYCGEFKNGVREGKGFINYKGGDMLLGMFADDKVDGVAKYFYQCDSLFWGIYKRGERCEGKMLYSSSVDIESQRPKFPDVVISQEQADYIMSLDSIARATTHQSLFMGDDANKFSRWVNSKLKVTGDIRRELAHSKTSMAKVTIQYTIDEMGKLQDVYVLKGSSSPSFDAMVLNVVLSSSQYWEPAENWGTPIKTTYTFPVILKL